MLHVCPPPRIVRRSACCRKSPCPKNLLTMCFSSFENAPTCYRAPKWPDLEFPRKIPKKIPPGPKFWTPRVYPQNTPKIPKKYPQNTKNAYFGFFFGIFLVFSWGSRISARGVFFWYFSWKFRVGPSRGSVAGRGVLNLNSVQQTVSRNKPSHYPLDTIRWTLVRWSLPLSAPRSQRYSCECECEF